MTLVSGERAEAANCSDRLPSPIKASLDDLIETKLGLKPRKMTDALGCFVEKHFKVEHLVLIFSFKAEAFSWALMPVATFVGVAAISLVFSAPKQIIWKPVGQLIP